jgi:hypothetical protein
MRQHHNELQDRRQQEINACVEVIASIANDITNKEMEIRECRHRMQKVEHKLEQLRRPERAVRFRDLQDGCYFLYGNSVHRKLPYTPNGAWMRGGYRAGYVNAIEVESARLSAFGPDCEVVSIDADAPCYAALNPQRAETSVRHEAKEPSNNSGI